MPTWTRVTSVSQDTEIGSSRTSIIRYYSNMEPAGGSKEENRRRRRRRSSDSVHSVLDSPLENIGAQTRTEIDRGSSAAARSDSAVLTPSEQHNAPLAPLSLVTVDHSYATTTRSPAEASSTGPSPRFSPDTRRHTGKRRASGEMIHSEEESKTMQPATPQVPGDEVRRPFLPERAVVSPAAHSSSAQEAETPREQAPQGNEPHSHAAAEMHTPTLPLRVSNRRTTMTTRWSPSMAGGREQVSKSGVQRKSRAAGFQRSRGSSTSPRSAVAPPARPISNATRNINFGMLQPHFEWPLQHAADSFGVCTTLLKKICRRNGISNWPYRKICGLRKSIASMAKQINYFDGDQKRAYADQLEKLEHELQAYLRTGNEPTEEFLRILDAEAAVAATAQQQNELDVHTAETGNENEEKEAQVVPAWSTRPSLAPPHYSSVQIVYGPHELQTTPRRPLTTGWSVNAWGGVYSRPRGPPLQAQAFPTIATHHRALPSIASILQHQSYSSPSRAASTQSPSTAPGVPHDEMEQHQQPQWRYFPPTNDDAS